MHVDQTLVDAAIEQLNKRWPGAPNAVAAAVYLDDGSVLTGVSLDNLNAAMTLCAETGLICQAFTFDRQVTASVCVARFADIDQQLVVLAPCGACQERLALWGPEVEVGVANPGSEGGWESRRLDEVNPYYWGAVFASGSPWPSMSEHI